MGKKAEALQARIDAANNRGEREFADTLKSLAEGSGMYAHLVVNGRIIPVFLDDVQVSRDILGITDVSISVRVQPSRRV